jgi:hypothetical protein
MSSKKIQYIALYFSRVNINDPKNDNKLRNVATNGSIAGLYARTDAARGVWKAPVGKNAVLIGIEKLDKDNGSPLRAGENSHLLCSHQNLPFAENSRLVQKKRARSSDLTLFPTIYCIQFCIKK